MAVGFRKDSAESSGANARNVWVIPTQGRKEVHFATFPDEIPRRCILAGTSEHGVCADCGSQWVRETEKTVDYDRNAVENSKYGDEYKVGKSATGLNNLQARRKAGIKDDEGWNAKTLGWQPTCDCNAAVIPATILDPFVGSGTSCAVAQSPRTP